MVKLIPLNVNMVVNGLIATICICEWFCWFAIKQLLFADDTALVPDSKEMLCRLLSEFGRAWERKKSRVNVTKSEVIR